MHYLLRRAPLAWAFMALACDAGDRGTAPSPLDAVAPPRAESSVGWAGCGGCETIPEISDRGRRPLRVAAVPREVLRREAPPLTIEEPADVREAVRGLMIYAAPSPSAPLRGRVRRGKGFPVWAFVEGKGCGAPGWGRLAEDAFVCLQHTRPSELVPSPQSVGPAGYYAKPVPDRVARRWSSLEALRRGWDAADELQPHHDYAFVGRALVRGKAVLLDRRGRAVLEEDVRRMMPSTFQGRDLERAPLPEGKRLAWVVAWPGAELRDARGGEAGRLRYHETLEIDAASLSEVGARVVLADGRSVAGSDLRIWDAAIPQPSEIDHESTWIDVDLATQILTVMRGDRPLYATLISSGLRRATPRGVFRIWQKLEEDTMSSDPGAADPYEVEGVAFVQYFFSGFALHGAYWHNSFGRPVSHGCVNLAPADARHVFSMTTPNVREAWTDAYESEAERGTVVQLRRGDAPVQDRRGDVRPLLGS